jgi:hypothetical protein
LGNQTPEEEQESQKAQTADDQGFPPVEPEEIDTDQIEIQQITTAGKGGARVETLTHL